ncbi:unnamed protein product [Microthlaspi erraticum]|uniref:Tryptophan synthase beta chain-like PALP domain-containing protein n=1 Tax=Microthlaspi erraticum TaxID=1685480 RepID=A0A6D2K6R7_9BRAS|nr:unnamed protein product [Microthlaspi erraticum]
MRQTPRRRLQLNSPSPPNRSSLLHSHDRCRLGVLHPRKPHESPISAVLQSLSDETHEGGFRFSAVPKPLSDKPPVLRHHHPLSTVDLLRASPHTLKHLESPLSAVLQSLSDAFQAPLPRSKLPPLSGRFLSSSQAPSSTVGPSGLSPNQVIWSESTMSSREGVASKVLQETGCVLSQPYNDGRIISGQGTIELELLEQVQDIDAVILPISGGGLISGVAIAAKSIKLDYSS